MPKFIKKAEHVQGGAVQIETDVPAEIAELKSQGFREVPDAPGVIPDAPDAVQNTLAAPEAVQALIPAPGPAVDAVPDAGPVDAAVPAPVPAADAVPDAGSAQPAPASAKSGRARSAETATK